jgi:hypothetical protein
MWTVRSSVELTTSHYFWLLLLLLLLLWLCSW